MTKIKVKQWLIASLESRRTRKVLWICLLGLTIIILLFPVSISPDYPLPVQSIYIFSNLSLFAGLFYAWMFLLLLLLFSGGGHKMEKLSLSLVFVLIFIEFWALISPWGGFRDGIWQIGHVHYLQEEGKIPAEGHLTFSYFTFPAFHLLGLSLSQVLNLDVFHTRTVFLLVNTLIFAIILFAIFLRLLKIPFYASLGVILSVMCSAVLGAVLSHFHPIILATTFIVLFVLLLTMGQSRLFEDWRTSLVFIILAIASTTEYLFSPFFFFLVILSTYVLHNLFKEKQITALSTAAIPAVLILLWEMYWTTQIPGNYSFNSIISTFPKILEDIKAGEFFLHTSQVVKANIGPAYPWWGNVTRFFWWVFVFGFGSFLMLWKLPSFKRYNHLEKIELALFVGTVLTIVVGAIGIRGAVPGGFVRYLWVAPFFLSPVLIRFFSKSKFNNYAFSFLFIALLVFSLPSFLTNKDTISKGYIYPQERALGEQLQSIYPSAENLDLYGYGESLSSFLFYVPDAGRHGQISPIMLKEEELWERVDEVWERFSKSSKESSLFIDSPKSKLLYQEFLGVPLSHPHWTKIESKFPEFNKVYANGQLRLYRQ